MHDCYPGYLGIKPECTSCLRSGRTCVYEEEQNRTQKLLDKVSELEEKLRQLSAAATDDGKSTKSKKKKDKQKGKAKETDLPPPHRSPPPSNRPSPTTKVSPATYSSTPGSTSTSSTLVNAPELGGDWWKSDPPPIEIQRYLVERLLLDQKARPCFMVHTQRFLDSLSLPPAEQPIPALLNAIYLMACHFSSNTSLRSLESVFLARARNLLSESLKDPRVSKINYIQATILIAFYLTRTGRFLEARHEIAGAANLTVACGLHMMRSSIWDPPFESTAEPPGTMKVGLLHAPLLELPKDTIDLGERICLFWTVFMLDHTTALVAGLPSSFENKEVETVWPRSFEEYERGTFAEPDGSIEDLYGVEPPVPFTPGCTTMFALRMKAVVLLSRVNGFAITSQPDDTTMPEFAQKFQNHKSAIAAFLESLPPLSYDPTDNEVMIPNPPPINVSLWVIYALAMAAGVHLYRSIDLDSAAFQYLYAERLQVAQNMTNLIREAEKADVKVMFMPIFTGFLWGSIAKVHVQHIWKFGASVHPSLQNVPEDPSVPQAREDLDTVLRLMGRMSEIHPIVAYQFNRLKAYIGGEEDVLQVKVAPVTSGPALSVASASRR
ncbi:hypothetical protein FRC03_011189 [Tulasnella sp. 419]|nr:hypothetical protein FRC03_011189 [Tulasnella sp. 419]